MYAHNNPVNYRDPSGLCGIFGDGPCTPGGIADDLQERGGQAVDAADDAWDATGGRVVSAGADVLSAVPDVAYDVQGWVGRNVIRPGLAFGVGGLGLTVGSNIGFFVGDVVCGVGPWAIPCALAGGAIGGAAGVLVARWAWGPVDSLLSRIPGWC